MDANSADHPVRSVEDGEFDAGVLEFLSLSGDPSQGRGDIAAEGVVVLAVWDVEWNRFVDRLDVESGVDVVRSIVDLNDGRSLVFVVLVADVTDDLFHDVFDRHQARDASVLVEDGCQMNAPLLELAKEDIDRLGVRDIEGLA